MAALHLFTCLSLGEAMVWFSSAAPVSGSAAGAVIGLQVTQSVMRRGEEARQDRRQFVNRLVGPGSKQVRKPKKDGWFEDGQNCHEYLELNFAFTAFRRRTEPPVPVAPVFLGDDAWML